MLKLTDVVAKLDYKRQVSSQKEYQKVREMAASDTVMMGKHAVHAIISLISGWSFSRIRLKSYRRQIELEEKAKEKINIANRKLWKESWRYDSIYM